MNHPRKTFPRPSRRRSGSILKPLLIILLIVAILVGGGWIGWRQYSKKHGTTANVILAKVTRGTFLHEVTGKGNAESAKNVDITCQVESAGGTTVIWIIPEGEMVKEGDELVLLDSSDLEDKTNTQQITCNTNAATVASSQASLRTAELSLEEYIEGTFEQNWMTIENSIYEAQEAQKTAADKVRYAERLVQFGYQTISQLEAEQVSEQKQVNTVRSNLLQQLVLLRYTSEKQVTQLMADIETARAKLNSDTYTNELAKSRLEHYKQQLENCTIKAPQAGQVVYANQDSRRWTSESDMIKEGSTVRERQVLIRLPDPNQMQVKTMINEANIAYVKDGMKAKIAFDALSNRSFDGTVIKVNQYPEISWMSSAKDYVTIVKIDNSVPEIRSGLTAEVKIVSQEIKDVLMLPVQCIVEVNGRNYVVQYREKSWSCKEVKIGLSNDKQVIIEEGISEGESVVSGARQYKDKVKFPPANEPSLYASDEPKEGEDAEGDEGAAEASDEKSGADSADAQPGPPQGGMPGAGPGGMPGGEGHGGGPQGGMPGGGGPGGGPQGGMPGGMAGGGGPGGMPGGGMLANLMKDGKLDLSKLPSEMPQAFRDQVAKADKNGDGFLDADEMKSLPKPGGRNDDRHRQRGERRENPSAEGGLEGGRPEGGGPEGGHPEGGPPEGGGPGEASESAPPERKESEPKAPDEDNDKTLQRLEPLKGYFDLTAMELCQRADQNGDKLVTPEELKATFPEMAPFFAEWDRNGDGKLSRTDLVIGFCSSRINYQKMTAVKQAEEEEAAQSDKESSGLKELFGKEPEELFTLLDLNKDGVLSSDEMPKENADLYKNLLTKMDTNEDGKLGREEFVKGIKKIQKMMGQGGSGQGGMGGPGGGPPPPP